MNQGDKKVRSIKGACKYCSSVILKQNTKKCPKCNNIDPFIPLEDAVINLLKRGYKLYAIALLTEAYQWDIKKAKEHCEELNIKVEISYAAPIDDLIENLALNGKVMQAIKMVRSHFKTHFEIYNQLNLLIPIFRNRGFEIASRENQNFWGLYRAKEYVELMYLNKE
jgi:hypothetical protein